MGEGSELVDTSERLVVFTHAVVAIALTLLVLPPVDLVPEVPGPRRRLARPPRRTALRP